MAPPVADEGSTKGVRTTLAVVNRRGRSGSAPLSGRFGDRKPNPLTNPGVEGAPRLSRHTPVLSGDPDDTGSSAVMAVKVLAADVRGLRTLCGHKKSGAG